MSGQIKSHYLVIFFYVGTTCPSYHPSSNPSVDPPGLNVKINYSKEGVQAERKVVISPGAMKAESCPKGRYSGGLGKAA